MPRFDHGIDPMVHRKPAHFLYSDTPERGPDDDKLKVFIFMKFIGEGHLDSEVLQLGYISEDGSKPRFSAVEPTEKLSSTLVKQLKYQKDSRDLVYQHDSGKLLINARHFLLQI